MNGNGRADILLRNRSTGAVTAWYMDGVTRLAYNTNAFPSDYAFVGAAFMNGDYRKDLLWAGPSGQLMVSLSTGMHFSNTCWRRESHPATTSPACRMSTEMAGADILLTSNSGSRLLVWYMDGATRSAYNSHAIDSNYRLVGKGDMNGDRRGDLVMSNPSTRQIKLLLSNGTSFTTTLLPYVPASGFRLMDVQ